jgi:hypothetical protein
VNDSNSHGRLWDRDLDRLPGSSDVPAKGDGGPSRRRASTLPRPWTVAAALAALICAGVVFGLLFGSPRMLGLSLIVLAVAPVALTIYALARELGLNTLFR